MTATFTMSAAEETIPSFPAPGTRGAGGVGPILYSETYASASAVSPAATGADNVMAVYSLPANTLNYAPVGSTITTGAVLSTAGLRIRAVGHYAANGNNKTVKLIFNATTAVVGSTVTGGTTVVTSGVVAINGLGWVIEAFVRKVGAPNSNTQVAGQILGQFGATFISPPVTQYPVAIENAAILIAVTGNAATTTTDIVLDHFEILATT